MSLFPAYSSAEHVSTNTISTTSDESKWLENSSFNIEQKFLQKFTGGPEYVSHSTTNSSDTDDCKSDAHRKKTTATLKKCKSSKKELVLEFTGDEDYYVDKTPSNVEQLKKLTSPRYHRKRTHKRKKVKRYFECSHKGNANITEPIVNLDENEFTLRTGHLNRKVLEAPGEIQHWLDLIELQHQNPYKWSHLIVAEKVIGIIERGLVNLPRNDALYRAYIDAIFDTYPSYEVSNKLDQLIRKDPTSYTLWSAQILNTQGSMACCNVPEVLNIYKKCMSKMHHANKKNSNVTVATDEIMLKLFNNCALFLRQTGLHEQFMALIKLALELNVSTDGFSDFAPLDSDERTLVEYEELVLSSGLPMNEIWLRIEKLRQCFNFLPCSPQAECSDPERIIFNEDICHYAYPLKSTENSFFLMLLIFRLLKLPFIETDCLAEKFDTHVAYMGNSDSIEDVLAVFLNCNHFVFKQQQHYEFLCNLYELTKEMITTPTFVCTSIGHEIYIRCIKELLENCSNFYKFKDERKRICFLVLLCRFERVLLIIQKFSNKLNIDYIKAGRRRFKALLKQELNRNVLNLYTEFAIYEYEALKLTDDIEEVKNIFENVIAANCADETLASDLSYIYVTYAEILIGRDLRDEAIEVLSSYALKVDIKMKSTISAASKLIAYQNIRKNLDNLTKIEENVNLMVLEQYLLPDHTVSIIKMHALMKYLIGDKMDALSHLEKLNKIFCSASDRHCFLREQILQIHLVILELPSNECYTSSNLVNEQVFNNIKRFPRNLWFMLQCGMLQSPAWYKLHAAMLDNAPNVFPIVFLIVMTRYRFTKLNFESNEFMYHNDALTQIDAKLCNAFVCNRLVSIFELFLRSAKETTAEKTKHKVLKRNALFWRLYLRCVYDHSTNFDTIKSSLLTALDNCPWSKALYMDGGTFVPQELPHLQDLMIEKQLRIYALPDELEILRQ